MILSTGTTLTTEEGLIPTMQPHSIQPFVTVTIAVGKKFEVLPCLDYTYLINNNLVRLQFWGQWNERCKLLHTYTCRVTDQFNVSECKKFIYRVCIEELQPATTKFDTLGLKATTRFPCSFYIHNLLIFCFILPRVI